MINQENGNTDNNNFVGRMAAISKQDLISAIQGIMKEYAFASAKVW